MVHLEMKRLRKGKEGASIILYVKLEQELKTAVEQKAETWSRAAKANGATVAVTLKGSLTGGLIYSARKHFARSLKAGIQRTWGGDGSLWHYHGVSTQGLAALPPHT